MTLGPDQQAMLQLLLERGQSYADLASVLGVDEAEVRSRARGALTTLAGSDPDRHVGLTDYLLGQADPIGRADAVRHLKDDADDLALATELSQKLLLIAPEAELPRLPGEERRPRPARAERGPVRLPIPARLRRAPGTGHGPAASPRPRTGLTRRQAQLVVGLGCAAVLLAVVIVAVAVGFGGGGNDNGDTTGTTTSTAGTQNLATVRLKPQTNESAGGTARFGLVNGQQAFVDVTLNGLQPPSADQTYVIWLLLTPDQGYPLSPIRPCGSSAAQPCLSQDGSFQNRFTIPAPILAIVTRAQLVDVSIAPTNVVRSAIRTAIKKKRLVIKRPGTSILQGAIPTSKGSKGSQGSKGG